MLYREKPYRRKALHFLVPVEKYEFARHWRKALHINLCGSSKACRGFYIYLGFFFLHGLKNECGDFLQDLES